MLKFKLDKTGNHEKKTGNYQTGLKFSTLQKKKTYLGDPCSDRNFLTSLIFSEITSQGYSLCTALPYYVMPSLVNAKNRCPSQSAWALASLDDAKIVDIFLHGDNDLNYDINNYFQWHKPSLSTGTSLYPHRENN